MRYDLFGPPNHNWIFEELAHRSDEERRQFFQLALQKMPEVISPEEVAQRVLHANSPIEVALKSIKPRSNSANSSNASSNGPMRCRLNKTKVSRIKWEDKHG